MKRFGLLVGLLLVAVVVFMPVVARADGPTPTQDYQYGLINCSGLGTLDAVKAANQKFETAYGYAHGLTTQAQWSEIGAWRARVNEFAATLFCPPVFDASGSMTLHYTFAKTWYGFYLNADILPTAFSKLMMPSPLPVIRAIESFLQTAPPALPDFMTQLLGLAGFAALVTVVVNVLKYFGVVTDGNAPNAVLVLNLLGLIGLVVAHFVGFDASKLDPVLGTIAQILTLIFGLATQLIVSRVTYLAVKGVSVLGYSHSAKKLQSS